MVDFGGDSVFVTMLVCVVRVSLALVNWMMVGYGYSSVDVTTIT